MTTVTRPLFTASTRGSAKLLSKPISVFIVFGFIYLLTWAGHYTSGDGAQKVAWAKAMLFRHTANLSTTGGIQFSKYSVGHSLIAMPGFAIAASIATLSHVKCEAAFYTLLFIVNGAFFVYLAWTYLMRRYSIAQAWGTVVLIGLCSTWWPYTKLDFSEPLVLTILFAGFLLATRGNPVLGVVVASLAITVRPDSVVQALILCLWLAWRSGSWRLLVFTGPAIFPALLINAFCNYVRWGSFHEMGYAGETFSTPLLVGLYGILFSAGKSIFLFSPPLILGVLGISRFIRKPEGRQEAAFFVAVFLSELLLYSKWWDWSGDDAWGVRFLVPGVMLICLFAVEMLKFRFLVAAVAFTGFFVQTLGVLINGLDYELVVRSQTLQRVALYQQPPTRNRVDFEDVRFNPRYSQLAAHWLLIRWALGFPPLVQREAANASGTSLYDALLDTGYKQKPTLDLLWFRLSADEGKAPDR